MLAIDPDRVATVRMLADADHDPNEPKYAVQGEVGQGSMGRVVLVRDNDLHRDVVIKTVSPDLRDDPESLQRFLDEARITGGMEHPNIVPIYDLGVTAEHEPYYSMRYVRGETLGAIIKRLKAGDADTHEQFSFARRTAIVMQLCDALAYAHARGVLHRDIKPENVMIGEFGEVLLMDWGIASDGDVRGTLRHELYCTPAYAPPEILQGGEATEASEVYSLGALMYELFALRPPHDYDRIDETLDAIVRLHPQPVQSWSIPVQGKVPREINNVIMRALSKDPKKRQDNVRQIAWALKAYQDGQAPVVCACTGAKRLLFGLAAAIDNHGEIIIGGTLLFIGALILMLVGVWITRT